MWIIRTNLELVFEGNMRFKLGLRPATHDPRWRWLRDYIEPAAVIPPTTPIDMSQFTVGHEYVMTAMLANGPDLLAPALIRDFGVGDCFFAAAVRFAALIALSKGVVLFTSEQDMLNATLEAYASCTGWDITQTDSQGDNPTDQGTDPTPGYHWLQTVGLLCSDGSRHKFGPMLHIDPSNFKEVQIAFNIAEGVMIGVNFPQAWENDQNWDATSSPVVGGHEIPAYSDVIATTSPIRGPGGILIDTWGNAAPGARLITPAGLTEFCTDLVAVIDPSEFGRHGRRHGNKKRRAKNVQGFKVDQWLADIAADHGFFLPFARGY